MMGRKKIIVKSNRLRDEIFLPTLLDYKIMDFLAFHCSDFKNKTGVIGFCSLEEHLKKNKESKYRFTRWAANKIKNLVELKILEYAHIRRGVLSYGFSAPILDLLKPQKRGGFFKIDIEIAHKFTTIYSYRLYSFLISYESLLMEGAHFNIKTLSYTIFQNRGIKNCVLFKELRCAVKEIIDKTNLCIKLEYKNDVYKKREGVVFYVRRMEQVGT